MPEDLDKLLSRGLEQYQEFIASGMSPEEASAAVIERRAEKENKKRLLRAASGELWSLVALVYLLIGFVFGWWHPGWLLFPFGLCLQCVIAIALTGPSGGKGRIAAAAVSGQVFLFLAIGVLTGRWILSILVVLFSLAVWQVLRLVTLLRARGTENNS